MDQLNRLVTLIAFVMAGMAPAAFGQTVAFENVNVIPMDRERVVQRQTVIVRDGRVAEMGPATDVKPPQGATRVDGSGKYLIPGLAEMHGHLTANYLPDAAKADVLFLYVANGVTTVRAMLGNPEAVTTREAIASGKLTGPKLYVAGPAVNGKVAPTPHDAERLVREQKAAGYDLLKILGGMPPEVYDSLMKTARSLTIDVGGHVPAEVGVHGALAAGQRSIDHLDQYIPALKLTPDTSREEEDRRIAELARLAAKSATWNVPTMYLWDLFHNAETGDALRTRLTETRYLPRTMIEAWVKSKNGRLRPPNDTPSGVAAFGQTGLRVMELRRKIFKALKAANAPIALGTDSPQMFSVPGFSTHRELTLMVDELGYTPYAAIESGTLKVAQYFGTTADTGTIAQGKRADMILLHANPLSDITNIAERAGVMLNGRWFPEAEIQKRLEEIAARAAGM
jgi:cytosine/adenosine deaminase-related metal-dependent hydrolase